MKKPSKPLFSGDNSAPLWNDIEKAKTVKRLQHAVYHLACRCQMLEGELRAKAKKGSK